VACARFCGRGNKEEGGGGGEEVLWDDTCTDMIRPTRKNEGGDGEDAENPTDNKGIG